MDPPAPAPGVTVAALLASAAVTPAEDLGWGPKEKAGTELSHFSGLCLGETQ